MTMTARFEPIVKLVSLWLLLWSWKGSLMVRGEGYPLHKQDWVTTLTDATFEHETQASTGGTTGSWMVWFHGDEDDTPIAGPVPDAEFWSEHSIVLAAVHGQDNTNTRRRFVVAKLPSFVYIHKGKYYALETPADGYVYNWQMIQSFCTDEYQQTEAKEIPPPRTLMDDVKDVWEKAKNELGGVYIQSMAAFFAFLTAMGAINKLFSGKPDTRKQKAKKS